MDTDENREQKLLKYCFKCKYGERRRKARNAWQTPCATPGECFSIPPTGFVHCDPDMTLEEI